MAPSLGLRRIVRLMGSQKATLNVRDLAKTASLTEGIGKAASNTASTLPLVAKSLTRVTRPCE